MKVKLDAYHDYRETQMVFLQKHPPAHNRQMSSSKSCLYQFNPITIHVYYHYKEFVLKPKGPMLWPRTTIKCPHCFTIEATLERPYSSTLPSEMEATVQSHVPS